MESTIARAAPWTALVLEDEFIIAFDLEERLTALGASEVRLASAAKEAARLIVDWRPTIALVDWRLADGTSDRFVQSLLTAGICVALVSGSFRSEIPIADQSRLRFLQKPVLDSDLAAAIGGLLDAI